MLRLPLYLGALSQSEESLILSHLAALEQQPVFNLMQFESVIDDVKSTVSQQLWQLLMEESDLLGQLQVLKSYFLLGRGELFLMFIELADNALKEPANDSTEHGGNSACGCHSLICFCVFSFHPSVYIPVFIPACLSALFHVRVCACMPVYQPACLLVSV